MTSLARVMAVATLTMIGGVTGTAAVAAQDIQTTATARGLTLPDGYWQRVAQDPDFFTLPNGLFRAQQVITIPRDPVAGSVRLPIVMALFADSNEPHISPEDVDQSLFSGPSPDGTITALYDEMSGGEFLIEGDVFPWVRTSLPMATVVGTSSGLGSDAEMGTFLIDALTANDPAIDFGLYDNDGPDGVPNSGDDDGIVDALTFEFLEVAASCGGPAIWPHRSSIAGWNQGIPYQTNDVRPNGNKILVNGYIVQSATDCSGITVQTAGVISHEFGHALGLPDYYHPIGGITPENRRWVMGCWSLMAAGSWGCGPVDDRLRFGPTHMISWSKYWLGWLDYVEVEEGVRNQEYVIGSSTLDRQALRVPLDTNGREYLLIEYREQVGFDDEIPTEGVLVVHQDFGGVLRPSSGTRYFLRMAEADGGGNLVRTSFEGGNRGEQGDAFGFPGAFQVVLNNESTPSIRLNTTLRSTVTVHSIEIGSGQATVRLSTAVDPQIVLPQEALVSQAVQPLGIPLLVAGGAAPYTAAVESGAPEGLEVLTAEDKVILGGAITEEGVFDIGLRVLDAFGTAVSTVVRLTVSAFEVANERVIDQVLNRDGDDLTSVEREYLDNRGNRNEVFDIGDARAWLYRQ